MEDMQHLAVIDGMMKQLQDLLVAYNRAAEGITEKVALLELRRAQNLELTEVLRQQRRGIDYHLGKPVVPENHTVECHMVGVGEGTFLS